MQASDDTVGLIWREMVDTDRMHRYYGYLAQRLDRLGDLLQIASIGAASGAVVSWLSHFPAWIATAAAVAAAAAALIVVVRRYPEKAHRSAEICRQLAQVHREWEHLWNGAWTKEDAELVSKWKALSERQEAIIERAPRELPLSRSLAHRSQREAYEYWMEVSASA